jgi:hypothetical protein
MINSISIGWIGHEAHMEKKNAYRILVGYPKGNKPIARTRHEWRILILNT